MDSVASQWCYLPERFPTTAALASPQLWESLLELLPDASDPPTLTLAVKSRQSRIRQSKDLATVLVKVRQASKAELREASRDVSFLRTSLFRLSLQSRARVGQYNGHSTSSTSARFDATTNLWTSSL